MTSVRRLQFHVPSVHTSGQVLCGFLFGSISWILPVLTLWLNPFLPVLVTPLLPITPQCLMKSSIHVSSWAAFLWGNSKGNTFVEGFVVLWGGKDRLGFILCCTWPALGRWMWEDMLCVDILELFKVSWRPWVAWFSCGTVCALVIGSWGGDEVDSYSCPLTIWPEPKAGDGLCCGAGCHLWVGTATTQVWDVDSASRTHRAASPHFVFLHSFTNSIQSLSLEIAELVFYNALFM